VTFFKGKPAIQQASAYIFFKVSIISLILKMAAGEWLIGAYCDYPAAFATLSQNDFWSLFARVESPKRSSFRGQFFSGGEIAQICTESQSYQISRIPIHLRPEAFWLVSLWTPSQQRPVMGRKGTKGGDMHRVW
jgi:hypothetical protein